jgi:hypothetical protein
MIAEVHSRGGDFTPADFDKRERLVRRAVVPEMLANYLAVFAAEARDPAMPTAMARPHPPLTDHPDDVH